MQGIPARHIGGTVIPKDTLGGSCVAVGIVFSRDQELSRAYTGIVRRIAGDPKIWRKKLSNRERLKIAICRENIASDLEEALRKYPHMHEITTSDCTKIADGD